ncbi:MAG: DUF559 domain-containing protein [Reichenbachiella sp.]|uniref:endonuclease domain-containing protein n=1 Tax=Reichenbachiella sp. TaxID=2184521 RepID=UPI003298281E
MNPSNYNKKLKPLARNLRNHSTPGEIKLWTEVLSARRFYGLQFNRQYPIENYIADFICRKLKLIIELDGKSHELRIEDDLKRDKELKELGYRTIRVPESDVMNDINNVIRTLEAALPDEMTN